MSRPPAPKSLAGNVVASVGVLTIAGLVYRFIANPPTYRTPTPIPTTTPPKHPPIESTPSSPISPSPSPLPTVTPSTQEGALHWSSNGYSSKPTTDSSLPSPNSLPLPTLHPPPTSTAGRSPFIPPSPIEGSLGKVALFLAAARSLESSLPLSTPPLLSDPFASSLSGDYGEALFRAIASASHTPPSTLSTRVAVRTKYFDDELHNAVTRPLSRIARYVSPTKIREGKETALPSTAPDASDVLTQVVIVGVGSDTRSLRLPLPEYTTVYEVDTEEVLAYREDVITAVIEKLGGEAALPSRARVVPVVWDVMRGMGGFGAALQGVGFNALKPTVWVCEGVLWVMKETAVKSLLSTLSSLSASHSLLLCDWVNEETLKAEGQKEVMEEWRMWGVRPLTGANLPEAVFAQCGWGAKVLQAGQEWEVDWGRVDEEWKRFHLKENVRGGAEDWPRDWIINAKKT